MGADVVRRVVETTLPTDVGEFRLLGYREATGGHEHLALVRGADAALTAANDAGVLTRVHSECLTGEALGSRRCDCGPQLKRALGAVADEGIGIVVYVRGHEGRGIGLVDKLRAYALQDYGADTVDANLGLGFPADAREYWPATQILHDLGVRNVRLLTNNPDKVRALVAEGISVSERIPLLSGVTSSNVVYLRTKLQRLGHSLDPDLLAGHE